VQLIRDLPGFAQNVRELPFCCPYSMKARALLHAHFDRKKLPSKTLDPGAGFVLFLFRVTTCTENLEMSGILTAVTTEILGI